MPQQHFHVKAGEGAEFTPDELAAAAAAREQCVSAALDAVRDHPIFFVAAATEGVEGESTSTSLSSQTGDTGQLLAFWCWTVQECARQLSAVTGLTETEAAMYLMQEMLTGIVLKDIPFDEDE